MAEDAGRGHGRASVVRIGASCGSIAWHQVGEPPSPVVGGDPGEKGGPLSLRTHRGEQIVPRWENETWRARGWTGLPPGEGTLGREGPFVLGRARRMCGLPERFGRG